jgi:lipopolysaccharide/colanic/teichoic acid biosynthesis glycosyltransferase
LLEQATRPVARTAMPAASRLSVRPSAAQATRPAISQPVRPSRGIAFNAVSAPTSPLEDAVKRALDLAVAIPTLIVLAPLMLVVAAAIRLDSPGPVLISQRRVSKGLRTFRMFKFRSMVANADELIGSLQALNEATPPLFKIRNDPRITRLGRHLRRLSIDELPQLINVVRGDMSLVGPRPPLISEVNSDLWRQSMRLRRAPGMTGLWQVSGRSELGYEAMVSLDVRYVRDWSILLDISILMRTPRVVVSRKGAH